MGTLICNRSVEVNIQCDLWAQSALPLPSYASQSELQSACAAQSGPFPYASYECPGIKGWNIRGKRIHIQNSKCGFDQILTYIKVHFFTIWDLRRSQARHKCRSERERGNAFNLIMSLIGNHIVQCLAQLFIPIWMSIVILCDSSVQSIIYMWSERKWMLFNFLRNINWNWVAYWYSQTSY